jgi:S-adenosylmethionine-diacylglycerol 3-amino-3-carboxypropyl transferase
MDSEVTTKADFSTIRYAQCWEDADILLEALDIQPGDVCLSIASAGDNTLAMLSKKPQKVIALDMSPAQLACLELRVAAYRALSHPEFLELVGSRPSRCRLTLYQRCRSHLSPAARAFWDRHPAEIGQGIGGAGKFERYVALFRTRILPLIHSRRCVEQLLHQKTTRQRHQFYWRSWNTWRWNLLFRLFFSRFVMGRLGRDPSFFRYVEGQVAERILQRTHYALTILDPVKNPYLQWIMTGHHTLALPYALRPENFETIRANLDRLEWRRESVESFLNHHNGDIIDRYNLSDIFEYMSPDNYQRLLAQLVEAGHNGTRLVYWNMLAPRRRPDHMAPQLRPLIDLSRRLHLADKAFFYSDFVIEEVV